MSDGVKPASTSPPSADDGQTNLKLELVGVAALVAPLVTAIGGLAATGAIGRVQRNNPELLSIGIGLVLAAGALWLIAGLSTARLRWARVLSCLAAVAGFVIALYAAVETADDEPRPQVVATLNENARELTLNVSASSMETTDRLAIFVDMLSRTSPDVNPVYRAFEGPDGDGRVSHETVLSLPRPVGYDDVGVKAFTGEVSTSCDDKAEPNTDVEERDVDLGSGTGCVTIALERRPVTKGDEDPPPADPPTGGDAAATDASAE